MTDIALYSLDENNVVIFGMANVERMVHGPEEALQVAAHHLLLTPGTNSWDRDEGGGLQELIRGNLGSISELRTDAAICVNRAMNSIRKSQSSDRPADTVITNLRLLDATIDRNELLINIKIRIDLLDGNSFQATFRVT
jgi:hypothetical protein